LVTGANGIFEGAKKVNIEFNNTDKTRKVTIYF
jgi:hypothetical protein